jgi:hypothetical protein
MKNSQIIFGMIIFSSLFFTGCTSEKIKSDLLGASIENNQLANTTEKRATFSARIVNRKNKPIENVFVDFIDVESSKILAQGTSNKMGLVPTILTKIPQDLKNIKIHAYTQDQTFNFHKIEELKIPYTTLIVLD